MVEQCLATRGSGGDRVAQSSGPGSRRRRRGAAWAPQGIIAASALAGRMVAQYSYDVRVRSLPCLRSACLPMWRAAARRWRELDPIDPQHARRILAFLHERVARLDDPRSIGVALPGARLGAF